MRVVGARVIALACVGISDVEAVIAATRARLIATAHSALIDLKAAHGVGDTVRGS